MVVAEVVQNVSFSTKNEGSESSGSRNSETDWLVVNATVIHENEKFDDLIAESQSRLGTLKIFQNVNCLCEVENFIILGNQRRGAGLIRYFLNLILGHRYFLSGNS